MLHLHWLDLPFVHVAPGAAHCAMPLRREITLDGKSVSGWPNRRAARFRGRRNRVHPRARTRDAGDERLHGKAHRAGDRRSFHRTGKGYRENMSQHNFAQRRLRGERQCRDDDRHGIGINASTKSSRSMNVRRRYGCKDGYLGAPASNQARHHNEETSPC